MNNNKLIIASAGSGKTTHLVKEALKIKDENVLITTYTENNEQEIKKKIIEKRGHIPANITIQTWFSFLLQHGVRPYQDMMCDDLHTENIGFYLSEKQSNLYSKEEDILKHYFTRNLENKNLKICSDKISKFICKCNEKTEGKVIDRITKIYQHIFVDEVQDLAGWDLEILKLFFDSNIEIILVGDPRQCVYLTNHAPKHKQYKNGKIQSFIEKECKKYNITIDDKILNKSHRNNQAICNFSSKLFPKYPPATPCGCTDCHDPKLKHNGVFLVRKKDIDEYRQKYNPQILRERNSQYPEMNYGISKGLEFDRVLIYPTDKIEKWLQNNQQELALETRCKFYVAITRAKYSVAIVYDYKDEEKIDGVEKYVSGE